MTDLDIVLPCYRPPAGWVERILTVSRFLAQRENPISFRIILVNDGTPEGVSARELETLERELPQFLYLDLPENQGKGAALREGVARSEAPVCIFTDVDFPYTLASLEKIFFPLYNGDLDVAIGIKDASYYAHLPAGRVRISRFLRWLARTFLRISISDTQCGLKGFNAKGRAIFLQTTIKRYLADLEFIFLVDRASEVKMKPFEVKLREGVIFSRVNLRILLTEGWNFFRVFLAAFLR
jgi:glycosyltransferase involved in cell wall biosynthesis